MISRPRRCCRRLADGRGNRLPIIGRGRNTESYKHSRGWQSRRGICLAGCSASAHSEKRKPFGQVDRSLGFLPLRRGQRLSLVLAVQQLLKAALNALGQSERFKILRHLNFQNND